MIWNTYMIMIFSIQIKINYLKQMSLMKEINDDTRKNRNKIKIQGQKKNISIEDIDDSIYEGVFRRINSRKC